MSGFTQQSILPYLDNPELRAQPPPRARPRRTSAQGDPTQRTLEDFEHYWFGYYETDDPVEDSASPAPTLVQEMEPLPRYEHDAPLLPADSKLRMQSVESRAMMLAHMAKPVPEYPPDQPRLRLAVQAACRLSPGAARTFTSCMNFHRGEAEFTYGVLQRIADSCELPENRPFETQLRYLLFTLRITIHWKSKNSPTQIIKLTHELGIELAVAETVLQHSGADMKKLTAVFDSGHAFISSIALTWLAFNKKWVYLHLVHEIWRVGPEDLFFLEPDTFEAVRRYGTLEDRDFGLWYVERRFEEEDVMQLVETTV